jgi:serine/threonine protein kinase
MTPEQWARAKAVFGAALARAPNERAAFVAEACGADAELRREVESLLGASDGADAFLAEPPAAVAVAPNATRSPAGDQPAIAELNAALGGRYVMGRELGRGGMATVYLARDVRHKRPVALKVFDPELAQSLGAARFLREIELAANLQHPHVVPVHDSGEAAGLLYYVMPFVDGESLRGRLGREWRLAVEDVVRIAREVADALDYAHGRGVVHRDIKPENILLSGGHALVADFGIARAVSKATEGAARETLTQTGLAVGTPAYMSPEQAAGEREVDGRSDVYSLGCVVYEMLIGETPFHGTSAEQMAKRFRESPPAASARRPGLPSMLDAVLLRSLALAPNERYSTAGEFAAALQTASDAPGRSATRAGDEQSERTGAETARPGRRRLSARVATATLVTVAASLVPLSFLHVPHTNVRVDVNVEEVSFELASDLPLSRAGELLYVDRLDIAGLQTGDPALRTHAGDTGSVSDGIRIIPRRSEAGTGQVGLDLTRPLGSKAHVTFRRTPLREYLLSIEQPGRPIPIALDGAVSIAGADGSSRDTTFRAPLYVEVTPRAGEPLDFAIAMTPHDTVILARQIVARGLSFIRTEQMFDGQTGTPTPHSTIVGGIVQVGDPDGVVRSLRPEDRLRWTAPEGIVVQSITADGGDIRVRFRGSVADLTLESAGTTETIMPSLLGSVRAATAIAALVSASALVAAFWWLVFRWHRRTVP